MSIGEKQVPEKTTSTRSWLPLPHYRRSIRYCLILFLLLVLFWRLTLHLSCSSKETVSQNAEQGTTDISIPPSISPSAVANSSQGSFNPHGIAALITSYYELMAKMRYFPSSFINFPPHSPPIDISFAQSLGLEPQVIELLQLLPYVEGYHNEDEFILGGSFADFRNKEVLSQSRDPSFAEPDKGFDSENGEYVRPWVLVLNECGNHGSIMYLDTKNSHISMQWQGQGSSSDPVFQGQERIETGPSSRNKNSIEHLPSRPANELFDDFMNRLITLEWIPFNHYGPRVMLKGYEEYEEVKLLFQSYGWPETFDGAAFDAAAERWREFDEVRNEAEESVKKVEGLQKMLSGEQDDLRNMKHGFWANDPNQSAEEVARLGRELKVKEQYVKELEEKLALALMEAEELEPGAEMERVWRKYLQQRIDYETGNLEFFQGKGKEFATEAKLNELSDAIAVFKARIKKVESLPKTVMDVIRFEE